MYNFNSKHNHINAHIVDSYKRAIPLLFYSITEVLTLPSLTRWRWLTENKIQTGFHIGVLFSLNVIWRLHAFIAFTKKIFFGYFEIRIPEVCLKVLCLLITVANIET